MAVSGHLHTSAASTPGEEPFVMIQKKDRPQRWAGSGGKEKNSCPARYGLSSIMAKLYCSLNTYTMSIIIKNLHSY
jgi:hypothetical protein